MNNLELMNELQYQTENDIKSVINSMDTEKVILFLLFKQELMFSCLLDSFEQSRERLSEGISYALKYIFTTKKIDVRKLQRYGIYEYVDKNSKKFEELIRLLLLIGVIVGFKIYISKQGYKLKSDGKILALQHDIEGFVDYYQMGYVRTAAEDHFLGFMAYKEGDSNVSNVFQEAYQRGLPFSKIIDKGLSTERNRFYFSNILFRLLFELDDGNAGYRWNLADNNYFSNNAVDIGSCCLKSSNIRWVDLMGASVIFSNLIPWMCRSIKNNCDTEIAFYNSILFPMNEEHLHNFFKMIFEVLNKNVTEKDIRHFINKFTSDFTAKDAKYDIQFKPILKLSKEMYIPLLYTFSNTNIIRAYMSNNTLSLDEHGDRFESEVLKIIQHCFPNAKEKIKFTTNDGDKGEVDICVLGNNNIYFIECKNKTHPISPSSSTGNYEYISYAIDIQLPKAEKYFNEDRHRFIKQNFGCQIADINDWNLHKIVVLSNRNCSGLNYKNVSIRDIYSLKRVLSVGYIEEGTMSLNNKEAVEDTLNRVYLWKKHDYFTESDFLDYLGEHSLFFSFIKEKIFKQTVEHKCRDYILKEEFFAFNILNKV